MFFWKKTSKNTLAFDLDITWICMIYMDIHDTHGYTTMFSVPDFKLHHIAFSLKTSDSIIGHQRISQASESKNQVESINHGGNQETNSQRIIIYSFYIEEYEDLNDEIHNSSFHCSSTCWFLLLPRHHHHQRDDEAGSMLRQMSMCFCKFCCDMQRSWFLFFQRWTAFNIFCVFKDICFKQAFPHCTAHVDFDFIQQTFGSAPTALTSYSTAYRPNGLCCFRAKRRIQGCCIYYHSGLQRLSKTFVSWRWKKPGPVVYTRQYWHRIPIYNMCFCKFSIPKYAKHHIVMRIAVIGVEHIWARVVPVRTPIAILIAMGQQAAHHLWSRPIWVTIKWGWPSSSSPHFCPGRIGHFKTHIGQIMTNLPEMSGILPATQNHQDFTA